MLSVPQDSDPARWLTSLAWPLPAFVVHIGILAFDVRVTELGCAAALLRFMLLLALYASAWRLAAAAFAHST